MSAEELPEKRNVMQSVIATLQHSDDARVCRDISQQLEQTRVQRRSEADAVQEALQQLSRRLQGARSRVDAAKAQREQKSHAETMRDMHAEQQTTDSAIAELEARRAAMARDIAALETQLAALDENVEHQMAPDENVLKLQLLRGLGVEPLANAQTGLVERARVWTPSSASVVDVRGPNALPPHQLAAQLWELCS
ncbi:hypothetical protein IWQ57_001248 [Coemansia nantahalensis]|uniref:Uncharacterized protein n=2 Tax=Coemansia TaxID=4863 RepID=A0ACC1LDS8_9FUNG|nr:hypothetical protein IWQ57_001248 [Coemansia nantahalensis]KAJ2805501.1 hypothetical protein H4R21_001233 [Coemansia helicoidea]